ncbi:hypothetical protein B296_00034211, partial [Ensete ventricosum]
MGTARTSQYIPVRQYISMQTAHYRAVPPIRAISARNRPITVDFNCCGPLSGGISRGRRKKREKKRENLEIQHRSPSMILMRRLQGRSLGFAGCFFSPCGNVSPRGEKERDD